MAAVLSPFCIFTPENAQDVAGGLEILVQTNSHFAVRSGGHTPIPGASGTSDGVLVASNKLRNIELSTFAGRQVVKVGPGFRWIEVYEWLANQGLTTVGGRYATVGIGGFSTGGGLSYYRSVSGWAADNILNYELVTAQGNTLQVNDNSNSNLFWALKGGSGNFGFITSFDFAVFPLISIFGGNLLTNASGTDALIKACASYADPIHGGVTDPLSAVNPTIQLALDTRQWSSFTNVFYNASVGSIPATVREFHKRSNERGFHRDRTSIFRGVCKRNCCVLERYVAVRWRMWHRRLFRATSIKMTSQAVELAQQVFENESAKLKNVTDG
ncbi:hypothetical protein MMC07_009757 [Pseudocyphellaria aurata]|nr:hypothetical protein [Pseudocyphellaria aurata]